MTPRKALPVVIAAAALAVGLAAGPAAASQLIDRNASHVSLAVNGKGEAMITYQAAGKVKHVLAWGAVNAIAPTQAHPQVAMKLDYAGGWGKYHTDYWKTFGKACGAYTGPALALKVVACTAPDGSYWALQSWQRELPDLGKQPTSAQAVWELRLSHWTTPLPVLTVTMNWAYRHFDHLFGTLTYNGSNVFGFHSTPAGQPLDTFGRNVYVDTFDSAYGTGWKRENSFLTHTNSGAFCYGFYAHGSSPAGTGTQYRATVEGPGVTPDVMWQGAAPGPFDQTAQTAADASIRALGDTQCKAV